MPMALTPGGGWHREGEDSGESWTSRTTHTGDYTGHYDFDQRFEHPGRTWAARLKVTPPLAVAPLAHVGDMRWNPNDDGINVNP